MKHIRLFYWLGILITAGFICFSCVEDRTPTSDGPNNNGNGNTDGEVAFLSINTICDELITKASTTDIGTAAEFHVEKVRIVLYDGKTGLTDAERKVMYAFDFDIKTNYSSGDVVNTSIPWKSSASKDLYSGGSPSTSSFTTYAREVAKQDYMMLVIVNPTDAGKNGDSHESLIAITAKDRTLAEFKNTAVSISSTNLRTKDNGGVAADRYFLMTNHKDLAKVPASSLKSNETDAHNTPISVAVDRVVAKVYVTQPAGGITVKPDGAKAGNFSWELDITNKMTYWMRIMDKKQGGVDMETEATGRDEIYAKDPNFENFSGAGNATLRSQHFNYVYSDSHATNFVNSIGGYQYALENTMGNSDQGKEEVMTRVVVRSQYAPAGFNLGDSYYVYTNLENKDYYIKASNMASYVDAPAYQIPGEYSGLKAVLDAGISAGYNFKTPAKSFKYSTIKYFHQGYSYYKVPIKHFGGSLSSISYGYYGIVRNNIYTISLQSIEGPGGITVEDGPFLSAGVNIVPWGRLTDGRDLGETLYSYITYKYAYENADGSFTSFATEYNHAAVGSIFPTITDQIKNAHFSDIPREAGGSQVFDRPGVVSSEPSLTIVSADPINNVYEIRYMLKKPLVEVKVYYTSHTTGENLYTLWRNNNPPFPFDGNQGEYRVLKVPPGVAISTATFNLRLDMLSSTYGNHVYSHTVPDEIVATEGGHNVVTLYYRQGGVTAIMLHAVNIYFTDAAGNLLKASRNDYDYNTSGTFFFHNPGEKVFLWDPALRIRDFVITDKNGNPYRQTDDVRLTGNYSNRDNIPISTESYSVPTTITGVGGVAYAIVCVPQ